MNPSMFRAKWEKTDLTERSAAHEHFLDLCALFDHPTPADADPEGEWFTFEKGAEKLGGGDGWADVWKREFFAWEYKGKHKNLEAAYNQLLQYRESLENPPLLVVCDMDRIVIRTNFTNTRVQKYTIPLSTLDTTEHLDILRAVFHDPEMLKPGAIRETITTRVASRIAELAQILRDRGLDAHRVARFLDRIVFCMFAEDIGLLPKQTSARIAENSKGDSEAFSEMLKDLFEKMAHGGYFGSDAIRHFNGNLFSDAEVLELRMEEIAQVQRASHLDWGAVDPSVFGTLFERGLDPSKRSQLGAHYTSRQDIETLVEPVVMQPLRREWEAVCEQVEALLEKIESRSKPAPRKASDQAGILLRPGRQEGFEHVNKLLHDFLGRLGGVKVLDPACGSGNFLYVTLQKLMDLEKEVNDYALSRELVDREPKVGPWQLYGIELNPYAYDLAQTTIWIGYLQWMHDHGYAIRESPVLRSMDNFRCMDAIIDLSDPANPKEPEWPEADFIVGNPPFLGGNRVRQELGDEYLDALFKLYQERVPAFADLCCYWFERARTEVARHRCNRAGLLATQGIRGGANREVLKRIKESGDIFFAESDRPWILEGANVHVSMIGFDEGVEPTRTLDGKAVTAINPDLTAKADISRAARLPDNASISFMGPSPKAPFDIDEDMALRFLVGTANVHGRPNSDVVRPVCSAVDMVSQPRRMWTIDFFQLPQEEAARYEAPFAHLKRAAQAIRTANRRKPYAEKWWLYAEPRPGLRAAAAGLARFLVTPGVAKHRVFVWRGSETLCNQGTLVFARSDDYFFGVLHSRVHEVWALKLGTRLETRPRYTPTTCFETFPFPEPTAEQQAAIGEAAKELNELRENWLNPPEWTKEEILVFPGSVDGPWARYVHDPDERGISTVRYPRIVPKDPDSAKLLAKRTLTNLYNERPTWLDLAHTKLDRAVFAAYGWDASLDDDGILQKLLDLNLERAKAELDQG